MSGRLELVAVFVKCVGNAEPLYFQHDQVIVRLRIALIETLVYIISCDR